MLYARPDISAVFRVQRVEESDTRRLAVLRTVTSMIDGVDVAENDRNRSQKDKQRDYAYDKGNDDPVPSAPEQNVKRRDSVVELENVGCRHPVSHRHCCIEKALEDARSSRATKKTLQGPFGHISSQ